MSGFATIIGFMFSFFAIIAIFFGAFLSYQEQIIEQNSILSSLQTKSLEIYNSKFDINTYFYMSGRLNFYIDNLGTEKLVYKDGNSNNCFSFFYNNRYIPNSNIFIENIGPINSNYKFIDINEKGILTINFKDDFKNGKLLKAISCAGIDNSYLIDVEKYNWWDENWAYRKKLNAKNIATSSIVEYQIEVDLNSSNFDFSTILDPTDFRFVIPVTENLALDLTFDNYSENLEDFSKYSNSLFLGQNLTVEESDPSNIKGVLFNALSFDGNDSIKILQNSSLLIDKQITIATWVKWNSSIGSSRQYIFTNGWTNNALSIVNDGGVNQGKVEFNLRIGGLDRNLFSNKTIDNNWHFLVARYDSANMEIFIDGKASGSFSVNGDISTNLFDNYIGSFENSNYFGGYLDEFKLFNYALNDSEIIDLYYNNLRFKQLDFYVATFDKSSKTSKIFVKLPYINSLDNVTFEFYYNNLDRNISSISNIETTFSYTAPRAVGYVVSDRISNNNGLNIFSLYNGNEIYVGNDKFSLSEQTGTTLSATSINQNDVVSMKYLGQVEGAGDGDDMIVPISWASKEFYFRGFRNSQDRFCMLSLWGNANVSILDNGVSLWNGVVDNNGVCQTVDVNTNNALRINSTIPILVSYYGANGAADSLVFYPATNLDLFGVPSRSLFVASGNQGATVSTFESDGKITNYNLSSYQTISDGTNGAGDGDANAYRIVTNNFIGACQQADGDGTEMTVFIPEFEMGTKFGSNQALSYLAIATPSANANCSVYDYTGSLIGNDFSGVGVNGIYKYGFNVGSDTQYTGSGWKLECEKPVHPYYETTITGGDETSLFGHLQMRQYIYPEPIIIIN